MKELCRRPELGSAQANTPKHSSTTHDDDDDDDDDGNEEQKGGSPNEEWRKGERTGDGNEKRRTDPKCRPSTHLMNGKNWYKSLIETRFQIGDVLL